MGARSLGIDAHLMEMAVTSQMLVERLALLFAGRPQIADNILLAGSGRSGTTWLAKILSTVPGTQGIFEPLRPRSREMRELTGWDYDQVSWVRLRYLRLGEPHPQWDALLARVLAGKVRASWTDYGRRSSYMPQRYLIKSIRVNLMLGYICDSFSPRIVYLVRHPCAVVHSRLRQGWQADLADILSQEELVEDYLQPWVGILEREKDSLGVHAAWWAVENAVALQQLEHRPHYRETYEALLLEPRLRLQRLLSWLDLANAAIPDAVIHEPAWDSDQAYESTLERLAYWQESLSLAEQHRILDWAHRLDILFYDQCALPRVV
jgi:hypothetical protein